MIKNYFFLNRFFTSKIYLINYFLFISINCRVIIPFKYIQEKPSDIPIPKEIMSSYMNEKIYIKLELGSPKQEIRIPIQFHENIIYIFNFASLKSNEKTNKIFDDSKSVTFKTISEDMEYDYEYGFNTYQNCSDIFYFLKDSKKQKYNDKVEMNFRYVFDSDSEKLGGFGLQIYPEKEGLERNMPCPLKILKEKNINNNYLWSIYFSKPGINFGDEGYLLLGDYPHDVNYNLGLYDKFEFDKNNFRTLYDISSQKTMNHEIQMSEIYFYNKNKKDTNRQSFFNYLKKEDFLEDIVIPKVSIYYVTKFNYNFGGILIPEYFKTYLDRQVFDSYIKSGDCFSEKIYAETNSIFFYCKNKKNIIKKIKEKVPTILFIQEHLKYNYTININDLIYEKNEYVYFLLFYSTNQKNKWILGKPFLKKYPFIFNPQLKNIGFYSSFLLTEVKYKTVIIIAIIISTIFIIIGLLVGRKKYKLHKIKKQQAMEMSNNRFISEFKPIEMNKNNLDNKLYKEFTD